MHKFLHFVILATGSLVVSGNCVRAGDWPMWRYDANRSGVTPNALPAKLHLHWARQYAPTTAAWPDQAKMQFDIVREPVAVGRTLYFNSSRYDAVRAMDTRTGLEKWTRFADGPIRFAPLAWDGRVYFTSDDGYLYCLDGDTGKLHWKVRGGPSDRRILGNERLISTWPARGAPVIADGTVYFAASIWPFMGIFIHAVDAKTGQPVWTNDGDGTVYMKQPHNSDSFAGVAPQGPIVAIGNRLLVPGGRSVPATLDRQTGKLVRFQLAENGKRGGGSKVAAIGNLFFNGGTVFDIETQKALTDIGQHFLLSQDDVVTWDKGLCKVLDLKSAKTQEGVIVDPKTKKKKKVNRWTMPELANLKVTDVHSMMKAGDRIYLGGQDHVTMLDWNSAAKKLTPAGVLEVPGTVVRMIAADDRLFAVTLDGGVFCFGSEAREAVVHKHVAEKSFVALDANAAALASTIVGTEKNLAGYGIVFGAGDGQLAEALVRQTKLHVIVVEPDQEKVASLRERWTKANLYGTHIAIVPTAFRSADLPPYLASVIVVTAVGDLPRLVETAYSSLRPYGGKMFVVHGDYARAIEQLKLPGAAMNQVGELTIITRAGALAGSANWTHENADAANTRVSRDQLVKAPMGVLWFGGPSHDQILPRHGHGPQPQVIDGRMIIEGVDMIRAIDIYTGRLLWETRLPGVGFFYNNLAHQPGANSSGGNFVSTSDGIYVAFHNKCVRLDPATGKKIGEFTLPTFPGMKASPKWGYISVVGDYLIGGADPLFDPKMLPPPPKEGETGDDPDPTKKKEEEKTSAIGKLIKTIKGFGDNMSASRHLVVLDRKTGKVLWTASAKAGFRHHAICVGNEKLFAVDLPSANQILRYKKDDVEPPAPRLVAFDLKTGQELWTTQTEVFGTWLSYSEKHDVLVEAGRVARDSLLDEPKGMRAYSGKDGKVLWFQKSYTGPAMILHSTILQGQGACDLLTGSLKQRIDPITGELVPWTWIRNYGCNTPAASEHLLTFRSGAAGFFDLCNDGGTGNFGGFRSSCTNNLIVAGGILTAPEYTRTCTCAYQNQSSIALIHMPDAELWTSFGTKGVKSSIQRIGLNLGGAGDRKADDGTLWLEHPSIGGISPAVKIATLPAKTSLFRRHSSVVSGPYNWVTSSGMKGINEFKLELGSTTEAKTYTVKLFFSEPDQVAIGKRVFDVEIEGQKVLSNFDITKEAGGSMRSVVKEFRGISARGHLIVRLTPSAGAAIREPILCGVELVADERKK